MKITDEMVSAAREVYDGCGWGDLNTKLRKALEAALADVPDPVSPDRSAYSHQDVIRWVRERNELEAKLAKVRELASAGTYEDWKDDVLDILDGD